MIKIQKNMTTKVTRVLFLFLFTMLSSSLQACQEPSKGLEVLSLEITPREVLTGEKANIKAEVRNDSDKMGKYDIPLMVNGIADNRKYVTLAPGGTEKIEFSLRRDQAGVYAVRIGEQNSTLEVREPIPATFKLSKLDINPTESEVNGKIIIRADIANIGEAKGKYTAEWKINGALTKTEEMVMLPGSTSFFVFTVSPNSPGAYTVNLGELTGQFTVVAPIIPIEIIPDCPPGTQYDTKRKC